MENNFWQILIAVNSSVDSGQESHDQMFNRVKQIIKKKKTKLNM